MGKSWGKPLTTIDQLELIVGLFVFLQMNCLVFSECLYVNRLCACLGNQVGVEST